MKEFLIWRTVIHIFMFIIKNESTQTEAVYGHFVLSSFHLLVPDHIIFLWPQTSALRPQIYPPKPQMPSTESFQSSQTSIQPSQTPIMPPKPHFSPLRPQSCLLKPQISPFGKRPWRGRCPVENRGTFVLLFVHIPPLPTISSFFIDFPYYSMGILNFFIIF